MQYGFPVLLAILAIEMIAASSWWQPYFTSGIRLYRSVVTTATAIRALDVAGLAEHFRGGLGPSLQFRELATGLVAFRETMFELKLFTYTPVMHGLLIVRPDSGEVVVEGRANWFTVGFTVFAGAFVAGVRDAWPILPFLCLLLVGIGMVQVKTYRKVGVVAALGHEQGGRARSSTSWHGRVLALVLLALFVAAAAWWFTN